MRLWQPILFVPLLTMSAGCSTTPLQPSSLETLVQKLECPDPPARQTELLPVPVFDADETYLDWALELLSWGGEEAKRRQELATWFETECSG